MNKKKKLIILVALNFVLFISSPFTYQLCKNPFKSLNTISKCYIYLFLVDYHTCKCLKNGNNFNISTTFKLTINQLQ